jgi:molybdopterin synthase sulfur carrier subunit
MIKKNMKIQIKYFGMLADKTGKNEEEINISEGLLVTQLNDLLEEKYPSLGMSKYRISHNHTLADNQLIIQNNAEIALLPPFAGG